MPTDPDFPSAESYEPTEYEVVPGQTDYPFPWPYIGKADFDGSVSPYVYVYHDNEEGARTYPSFTMPDSGTIRLATALYEGRFTIARRSGVNGPLVDFASGATLSEATLDVAYKQIFYLWQELLAVAQDAFETTDDKAKFNADFTFVGDGTTTDFRLISDDYTIDYEVSEVGVWPYIGSGFVQPSDRTLYQDTDGVIVLSLDRAPEVGETLWVGIAQIEAIAATLDDDSIDCDKLQDGAICSLDKFDLDGEGSSRQVMGWNASTDFGARSLSHDDISDFDAEVVAKRLDQFAAPTSNVSFGGFKITSLDDPTSDQHAATKAYVDEQVATVGTGSANIYADTVAVATSDNEVVDIGFEAQLVHISVTFSAGSPSAFSTSFIAFPYANSSAGITVSKSGDELTFSHSSISSTATIRFVAIG